MPARATRTPKRRVVDVTGLEKPRIEGHADVDGTAHLVAEDRARRRAPVSSARRMAMRGARASHLRADPEEGRTSGCASVALFERIFSVENAA